MSELVVDLDVRISDLGPSGHVNNVAYLRLLDEARSRVFGVGLRGPGTPHGGLLDVLGDRARLVIGQHLVEFRREVWHPVRTLQVRMWIPALGRASLAIAASIHEDGHDGPAVVAESSGVLVECETGRPWPMDAATREAFERYPGPRPLFRNRVGVPDPRS